ncbi:hypothetical protein LEA_15395, partial [human gut metagenome]
DKDDTISYYTMPMGIIITDSHVVTVCLKENIIIDEFTKRHSKRYTDPVQNKICIPYAAKDRRKVSPLS